MTELAEKPVPVDYGANDFFEAAFLHKYKDKYYFTYNQFGTSKACYAIGESPYGPFVNKEFLQIAQMVRSLTLVL